MSDNTAATPLQTLEAKLMDPATDIMIATAIAAGIEKLLAIYHAAKAGHVTPEQALAAANAGVTILDEHHTAALAAAKAIEDARFPVGTP